MFTRSCLAPFGVAGVFLAGTAFSACSSSSSPSAPQSSDSGADSGPPLCTTYAPPATFSPTTPAVSFSQTVMPIFSTSCGLQSCHGSTSAPQAGLYLGDDPSTVYENLVGVAAMTYPQMSRITAGDPAHSYLQFRIDNDACTLAGCTTIECSELMPQGGPELAESDRLQIRGWIAQGALNDLPDAGSTDAGADSGSKTEDSGSTTDASDTDAADSAPPEDAAPTDAPSE